MSVQEILFLSAMFSVSVIQLFIAGAGMICDRSIREDNHEHDTSALNKSNKEHLIISGIVAVISTAMLTSGIGTTSSTTQMVYATGIAGFILHLVHTYIQVPILLKKKKAVL